MNLATSDVNHYAFLRIRENLNCGAFYKATPLKTVLCDGTIVGGSFFLCTLGIFPFISFTVYPVFWKSFAVVTYPASSHFCKSERTAVQIANERERGSFPQPSSYLAGSIGKATFCFKAKRIGVE